MTLLCVPITLHDPELALADAAQARLMGADCVELRIDEYFGMNHAGRPEGEAFDHDPQRDFERQTATIAALVERLPLPCIITCRLASEGGGYDGDEDARVSLLEALCVSHRAAPPRWIDVEFAAYGGSANIRQKVNLCVAHPGQVRQAGTALILSAHDFRARPADLLRRLARMADEPAAGVVKLAYRARSVRENLEALDLAAASPKPMISLCMGEFGLLSRVLAPKFGGYLTFAALRSESATAPGQPTLSELLELYRFKRIGAATRVYGVVGWPLSHSLSPHIHNAGFEAVEHDAVYLPLPLPTAGDEGGFESLKATLLELAHHPRLDFCGCSVTLPHKENLVRLAIEQGWNIDAPSRAIGAANTLVIQRSGEEPVAFSVANTDAPALADELADALSLQGTHAARFAGINVAILGAGGVARAAAWAVAAQGGTPVVYARRAEAARSLADDLRSATGARVVGMPWQDLHKTCCQAIINATPVGMKGGPGAGQSPVDLTTLTACERPLVFDTVYSPRETPLLKQAADLGWPTRGGEGMFVRQAAAQFEAWTSHKAPSALFRQIVAERLGSEGRN
ncbi:MAG: type I 3-dehydroquinate dehydratase [Phycisphaeraceae bacterium]|nr:type I 3-dehydroquinate dehydratase [Phycisphaeraceae bacterium]